MLRTSRAIFPVATRTRTPGHRGLLSLSLGGRLDTISIGPPFFFMIKFNFFIDKETAFVYWAQRMIEWTWYFNEKYPQYFISKYGELDAREKNALDRLRGILQKEENGYLWLWRNYTNEGRDPEWIELKEALSERFDKIWADQLGILEKWREYLDGQDYDYSFNKHIPSLEKFFNIKLQNETIQIFLLPTYEGSLGSAATKKGFDNYILMEAGNFNEKNKEKKKHSLWHELIHLFLNRSDKESLMKERFTEILKPTSIKQKNPSWEHLITESIIFSIAGEPFSYLDGGDVVDEKSVARFDDNTRSGIFHNQIMVIAYRISELTKQYLDQSKEMDREYIDEVLNTWMIYKTIEQNS